MVKAVLCKAYGPPANLVIEEIQPPQPAPGQVLIEVKACAVNFPDTLIIQGKYQQKPDLPFSPGCEVAGLVKQLGDGVESFEPGDAVIAVPGWGGFAEQVVVDAAKVFPLPDGIGYETAAAFVMAYGTSHHALKDRAQLKPGETLLVLGAGGGVGLAAVEIGKVLGARVIAAASSAEKLALCRRHGADETVDYLKEAFRDRIKALTDGHGVDVVYDPVGGALTEPALRSVCWRGRYLVVGFASGEIPRIPLNLALLKGCSIVGVFWGAFTSREPARNREDIQELFDWLTAGKLRPHIGARFPLTQAAQALEMMDSRKAQGKIVLVTG